MARQPLMLLPSSWVSRVISHPMLLPGVKAYSEG
uniref:Uncharacterized protein n=1 Tax=Rhizophora mucronata TaxID=61149 RepID=A0A2P2PNY1_RHIMU